MEILKLKNAVPKTKNLPQGLNSRLELVEESVCED